MSENQAVMFAMIPGAIAHSAGLILVIAARLLIATVRFEQRNDSIVASEGGYTVIILLSVQITVTTLAIAHMFIRSAVRVQTSLAGDAGST